MRCVPETTSVARQSVTELLIDLISSHTQKAPGPFHFEWSAGSPDIGTRYRILRVLRSRLVECCTRDCGISDCGGEAVELLCTKTQVRLLNEDLERGAFRSAVLRQLVTLYTRFLAPLRVQAPDVATATDVVLFVLFFLCGSISGLKEKNSSTPLGMTWHRRAIEGPADTDITALGTLMYGGQYPGLAAAVFPHFSNSELRPDTAAPVTPRSPRRSVRLVSTSPEEDNPTALELSAPRLARRRQATPVVETHTQGYSTNTGGAFQRREPGWYNEDASVQSFFVGTSPPQVTKSREMPHQMDPWQTMKSCDPQTLHGSSPRESTAFRNGDGIPCGVPGTAAAESGPDSFSPSDIVCSTVQCSPVVSRRPVGGASPGYPSQRCSYPASGNNDFYGEERSSGFPSFPHATLPRLPHKRTSTVDARMIADKLYYTGLPELALLRDLLYPLQGIDGTYVKYHAPSGAFLLRQDIVVSSPVRILTSRICAIGAYYRRIRAYLEPSEAGEGYSNGVGSAGGTSVSPHWWVNDPQHSALSANADRGSVRSEPPCEAPPPAAVASLAVPRIAQPGLAPCHPVPSLIHEALQQFLRDQLSVYYKLLAVIENEILTSLTTSDYRRNAAVNANSGPGVPCSSLRKCILWLQEPMERMALLAAEADVCAGLKGGPLLSVVFDHSQRGDVTGRSLLTKMLNHITVPWMEMVYQWVQSGRLVDPYDEFFVKADPKNSDFTHHPKTTWSRGSSKVLRNVENIIEPERLWSHGYSIQSQQVPSFISPATSSRILTCGKTVAITKYFEFLETRLDTTAISFHPSLRGFNSLEDGESADPLPCGAGKNFLRKPPSGGGYSSPRTPYRQGQVSHNFVTRQRDAMNEGTGQLASCGEATSLRCSATQHHTQHQKHIQLLYQLSGGSSRYSADFLLATFEPLCDVDGRRRTGQYNDNIARENGLFPLRGTKTDHSYTPDDSQSNVDLTAGFHDLATMQSTVERLELQHSRTVVDLLLYRYHLLCHCEGIRRFLLLGQGDFVAELLMQFFPSSLVTPQVSVVANPLVSRQRVSDNPADPTAYRLPSSVVSDNGCDLTQPARRIFAHQLRSSLHTAVASSNAQYFPEELLKRLTISKLVSRDHQANHLTGWEVVSLDYVTQDNPVALVLDATSIRGYRRIHSLLWRIHRVSYALNRVWLNHIRNCRRRAVRRTARRPQAVGAVLEELDLDTQWAITKCEALYSEITHFLRNLQSFFMYEVIEPSWLRFVEQLGIIVHHDDDGHLGPSNFAQGGTTPVVSRTDGSCENDRFVDAPTSTSLVWSSTGAASVMSQVDQVLMCHRMYLSSMLNGLFLDNVHGGLLEGESSASSTVPPTTGLSHSVTPLDILSETPYDGPSWAFSQQHKERRRPRSIHHPTLDLILCLLQYVMSFVALADAIFGSMYGSGESPNPLDPAKLDSLDHIAHGYRTTLIEFLKHLSAVAKVTCEVTTGQSVDGPTPARHPDLNSANNNKISYNSADQPSKQGRHVAGKVVITHHDAIRSLLYRLDFNNFYGSDWELYRRCPLSTAVRSEGNKMQPPLSSTQQRVPPVPDPSSAALAETKLNSNPHFLDHNNPSCKEDTSDRSSWSDSDTTSSDSDDPTVALPRHADRHGNSARGVQDDTLRPGAHRWPPLPVFSPHHREEPRSKPHC